MTPRARGGHAAAAAPASPPPKPGAQYLDKAALVRAAADLADRVGWSNLTLSQVAKDVNRHVTSLYAHVDSLDALRREVTLLALEELADEVWRAALGRTGEDALASIAAVERAYAREHPGRQAAMFTRPQDDDEEFRARGLRLAEPIRATLRSFGLDDEQVVLAHGVFSSALRGLTMAEVNGTYPFADVDETHEQLIHLFAAALSTGHWPVKE